MTFDAAASDMTIVEFSRRQKLMRFWSEGTRPAGYAATCGTNKVVQRLLQLRTRPCVSLLVMTRLAAALWPSRREERRVGALSAVLG
jgi:hypothetical protein